MKAHYYFGWFNETMPKVVGDLLNEDLIDKKSLVMICTRPSDYKDNDSMSDWVKESWFDFAGVVFDEYYTVDYRMKKEEAQALLRNASAIFLHGGYPDSLKDFLAEYEMSEAIKESAAAVVMGASAGGMNLSAGFAYERKDDDDSGECELYDGLGFDDFAFTPHATKNVEELKQNERIQKLMLLSQKMDVYAGCEESTIRVKDGKIEVIGDVFLVTDGKVQKVCESDFEGE